MNVGVLDRKILLEGKTPGQSGSGEPTESWTPLATATNPQGEVWANVVPLSGSEYYAQLAAQIVAEETLVFRIRFRSDVRAGTARITYPTSGGRIYNIRHVSEVGRREMLDCHADTKAA